MLKRFLCLALTLTLIFSLCSCSVLESIIPGVFPDTNNGDSGEDQKPNPPSGDSGGDVENGGNGETGGENPVCDCWVDSDGDMICDACGSGGLIPPDNNPDNTPECAGHVDWNADKICDNCKGQIPTFPDTDRTPVIFLAGDSTVKTYEDNQYIAGWGQFLSYFLGDEIVVKNAAHGGRSSRSFINEGRLYDIEGNKYTFSQNGGNSIADEIKAGDYLFIQFGHNDDASKLSNYQTIYDRMVPLGTPDANGIYPTTPAEKLPTDYLPEEYTSKASASEKTTALSTIAKYGDEYYAYGSGTYKWYLKQYIDFARNVGAVPVLITPVARVKFNSDGEIIGGAGLHGENFAYVEAVRQLAEEEDCLLIDLFAESKEMLEVATPTYANYLMALKPNELTGTWPIDYDAAYGNTEAGYTGIEATHYNKYGAFLQAAAVADHILQNKYDYSFSDYVNMYPYSYIDPSNLISRNTVNLLEILFYKVNVTNPGRVYMMPETVVALIDALATKGEVTKENYLEIGAECEAVRQEYARLNVDFKHLVTNISVLEEYEAKVKEIAIANRPTPTRVVVFNADNLSQTSYTSTVVEGEFTLVGAEEKAMEQKKSKVNFTYGGETYETTYGLSVGGKATFGSNRYISFTVDGPCTVTVAVRSSGTDVRTLTLVNSAKETVGSVEAPTTVNVGSIEVDKAGTYSVGSAGSGMYIYMIIIEYFD